MKLDLSTLAKAREWFARRWKLLGIGTACLLGVLVLAANIRAHIGRDAPAPPGPVATVRAPATSAPAKVDGAALARPAAPIPHIAQQPATASPNAQSASVAPPTPLPVAAPIQPPAGIQAGLMLQKNFQQAQFGLAQISADVVSVQTLSVQAPATAGDGERATEWSAWFNLAKPTTIAWIRLAGGEGTVAVTIDGTVLGEAADHWQTQGAVSNLASAPLAAGWHQITIHDTRRSWVTGPGVAARVDLGDGTGATVSPQPWAVPLAADAPANPHIAQQPAAASTAVAAKPAKTASVGAKP